jgi:general secretion pathway protein D
VGSESLRGEIFITADEVRNALIIEATPRDYRIVESILKRLDVLPRQVLIEVIIAEISLDQEKSLGINWTYFKDGLDSSGNKAVDTGLMSGSITSDGLQLTIGFADLVKAEIAAQADKGTLNILSTPSVLASDNREAQIDVSREIPVASSQFRYTSDADVTETNIQYRDTGIILSVTPHINERGLVTMDISQEVSELEQENIVVGGESYPAFLKRNVNTTLTVQHGQTIVIGGLIREKKENRADGMPYLVNVPVIKYLFGREKTSSEKEELIILITPYVMNSLEDVDSITDDFKMKVERISRKPGMER